MCNDRYNVSSKSWDLSMTHLISHGRSCSYLEVVTNQLSLQLALPIRRELIDNFLSKQVRGRPALKLSYLQQCNNAERARFFSLAHQSDNKKRIISGIV